MIVGKIPCKTQVLAYGHLWTVTEQRPDGAALTASAGERTFVPPHVDLVLVKAPPTWHPN